LVATRGLEIVEARSILILLPDGDDLVVTSGAGIGQPRIGARIPVADPTSGQVMMTQKPTRIVDMQLLRALSETRGVGGTHSALLVPLVYHNTSLGVLAAFDLDEHTCSFTGEDEQLLVAFAASAATAVATAQSVATDRLRFSLDAAEAERMRWARELHDETLQALGAMKVLASSAREGDSAQKTLLTLDRIAIELELEIESVHAMISELRPPALDDLGLRAAIETLALRHRNRYGIEVTSCLELPDPAEGAQRLEPSVETTVYRVVQEALNNVARHADAERLKIIVAAIAGEVTLAIADDGEGFDVSAVALGFGLIGIRERVALAGGTIEIVSGSGGTTVRATLPLHHGSAQ
jgi:signal transduction histidine kinase